MYTELNMKIWIMEGSHTYQSLSASRNRSGSSNVPPPKKKPFHKGKFTGNLSMTASTSPIPNFLSGSKTL